MKTKLAVGMSGLLLASLHAFAGQMCGNQRVADKVRTCPNGDMPMFVADEVKPYTPQPAVNPPPAADSVGSKRQSRLINAGSSGGDAGSPEYYFGVWRTRGFLLPGCLHDSRLV